jgi:hypothetical protein
MEIVVATNVEIARKKPKGRPSEIGIICDELYFNKYYHQTKKDVTCECGSIVSNKCMSRHLKRKVHSRGMMLLGKN